MRTLTKREKTFQERVWDHYKAHGRTFPWRDTTDAYHILVSEIMLQQTQVTRVESKYGPFLQVFPTLRALSEAPLGEVLRIWQGLGYNRRAKMLHQCAKEVMHIHGGILPESRSELRSLPGIGIYTAGAVRVFAYGYPDVLIETNIRSVYLYHFFRKREGVLDAEILPHVERTCDRKDPRQWYFALMDYGSHLKRTIGNQNIKSRHYAKQSRFEGSDRQIRGGIVRELVHTALSTEQFLRIFDMKAERVRKQLTALETEGMIVRKKGKWYLTT